MQDDAPPTQHEVTIDEAAQILGISTATVRRHIKRGRLEAIKASTPTGFIYRVRLSSAAYAGLAPTQDVQPQIQRYVAPEAIAEAFRTELRTLVEENARQARQHQEQIDARDATIRALDTENGELRAELDLLRPMPAEPDKRPWWRRLLG